MKKSISTLLIIVMVLSMSGCGQPHQGLKATITERDTTNLTTVEHTEKEFAEVEGTTTTSTTKAPKSKIKEPTTQKKNTNEVTNVTETTQTETTTQKQETTTQKFGRYANKTDEKAVAERVAYYINKYRQEEGNPTATKLSRMTEYAEYRSRQLVSYPHHSTKLERIAATELKYGEYIEPSLYGMTGEPYYQANCAEAVAGHGYLGTVDEVAKDMADLFRNSPGHWSYVGAKNPERTTYKYIGVGVTYENGYWYCCVCVSGADQYG